MKIGILMIMSLLIVNTISSVNAYNATENNERLMAHIKDPANDIPGKAVVMIFSNVRWSGNIMDSSFDSATIDGYGDRREVIDCSGTLPIYSLAIQKQVEDGYVMVVVVQHKNVIDVEGTDAAYGIVSLSGKCS